MVGNYTTHPAGAKLICAKVLFKRKPFSLLPPLPHIPDDAEVRVATFLSACECTSDCWINRCLSCEGREKSSSITRDT